MEVPAKVVGAEVPVQVGVALVVVVVVVLVLELEVGLGDEVGDGLEVGEVELVEAATHERSVSMSCVRGPRKRE